jgi:rRNA maturation RNase YbeY
MILNRQKKVSVDLRATRDFVKALRKCLRLGPRQFNVCFVEDCEIAGMNAKYRGKPQPTDVLSFPWHPHSKLESRKSKNENRNWKLETGNLRPGHGRPRARADRVSSFDFPVSTFDFRDFLGDIVISAETARQNARAAGHSTAREIRWLILHGVLHLLGFDHETDRGDMTALEHSLRARLNT